MVFTAGAGAAIGLKLIAVGVASIAAARQAKSLEQTGALQRTTPSADPNALGAFIFGTTAVPMNLIYEEVTGSSPDRVLHDIYAHAWHRIQSYESMTVATEAGPETVSFSGNAATGAYSNLLWWFRANGTQSAALSGTPFDSNSWPSTAHFTGVAHSALVWNMDDDNFKAKFSSVPTKIEIVVKGAWLYDPRLDPTYGSGSQDFDTPSTWSFNDGNAALVLLRALIGEYSGSDLVWGRGADEADIDMASFITAANVADESIDGDIRYRLGGMWLLSGSFEEFVLQWQQETGGVLSKSGGRYTVWLPNDDLTPATTITEADILGDGKIQTAITGLDSLYNTARGRYIDATAGYVGQPYPEVTEDSAVTEDGGKRVMPPDFSWVQSEAIAQRVARYKVRRSRYQRVWTIQMGWKGQSPSYAVFSVHNLNTKDTNYSNQLVRVIDRRMSFTGVTILTLQEEASAIYNDTDDLGDSLAGNNVTSKTSIFGTLPASQSPLIPWTPVLTNVTRVGNRFTKTGGTNGVWDSAFSSQESYPACLVEATVALNTRAAISLNSDPTTDASYTSLDHALHQVDLTSYQVFENGSLVAVVGGTPVIGDRMSISYDGQSIQYFVNGVLLWTTQRLGAKLYADSSFYYSGASLSNVTFAPFTTQRAVLEELRDDFQYTTATDFARIWLDRRGTFPTDISFLTGLTDSPAGTALRVGNNSGDDEQWGALNRLMPYDGVSLYEVGCIVRKNSGSGVFYCGVEAVKADGITLLDITGAPSASNQHYFAASGVTPGSGWTTYRGFFKGRGTSSIGAQSNDSSAPGKCYNETAFVRPLFITNYNSAAGQMDIAAVWVRRLGGALNAKNTVNTPEIDGYATEEGGEVFDAGPISHSTVA